MQKGFTLHHFQKNNGNNSFFSIMRGNMKNGEGFTFIELIIVIALIFLFSGLIFPINYSVFKESTIRNQARNIENSLRKAQAVAIANRGDSSSGIKFFQTSYALFEGESYSGRRKAMDMVFALPIAISFSGVEEIVFEKTTGLPIFPGLISHWKFNEESGNKAYDSSGNNNHASLNPDCAVNNCPSRVAGKDGSGLSFDGLDDYVQATVFQDKTTISLWYNPGSEWQFLTKIDNIYYVNSFPGTANVFPVYVNGNTVQFGKNESGGFVSGIIDDVRIYEYALSNEDIKTNYLARKDDIVIGLKFGENRKYISINSQGKIEAE